MTSSVQEIRTGWTTRVQIPTTYTRQSDLVPTDYIHGKMLVFYSSAQFVKQTKVYLVLCTSQWLMGEWRYFSTHS